MGQGWNGWLPTTMGLIPGYQNNETMYYAAADILVSSGLRDVGYDTILVTCAGWQRDNTTGKLMENPVVWPRGYKAFIDYLHARKLKIGAYGDTMLRLSDGAICAPPPPPPPPSCPEGYTAHESGFWRNTDPCNSNFTSCTEDHQNATVRTRVHLLPAFAVADKFSRTRAGNKMCEEVQRNEWLRCV